MTLSGGVEGKAPLLNDGVIREPRVALFIWVNDHRKPGNGQL